MTDPTPQTAAPAPTPAPPATPAQDTRAPVQVIAIATGFDGVALREPGATFDMPAEVFDKRPRLDANGDPLKDQYYEPPHWFEPVDASLKQKVEADRRATRKAVRVPAIDPARQQADAQAEGRLLAIAQEAVRQEFKARDDAEVERRVQEKLAELKSGKPAPTSAPAKKADEKP